MAASTDFTADHLETLKRFYRQVREISVQRHTLSAKYFEKLGGFEDKDLKHVYFDEIHQASLGKDFESEYSDIIHGEIFGNKD